MKRLTALLLALTLVVSPLLTLAEEEAPDPATEMLMDFVQSALDAQGDLIYDRYDARAFFYLDFNAEDKRLGDIYAYLDIYSTGVLFMGCYGDDLPKDRIDEGIRFANLINFDMLSGKVYIDADTGTIYYEIFLTLDFVDLNANQATAQEKIIDLLMLLISTMDYDVEYFAAVAQGETAENAYAIYSADYAD